MKMAHKFEIMRKYKLECLQLQQEIELERIQEQEREMHKRQEQQNMGEEQPNMLGPQSQFYFGSPVNNGAGIQDFGSYDPMATSPMGGTTIAPVPMQPPEPEYSLPPIPGTERLSPLPHAEPKVLPHSPMPNLPADMMAAGQMMPPAPPGSLPQDMPKEETTTTELIRSD